MCVTTRGGILGVRCSEILLISSSTLPGLGRVSAKNINKLTDFNAAVSSPAYYTSQLFPFGVYLKEFPQLAGHEVLFCSVTTVIVRDQHSESCKSIT